MENVLELSLVLGFVMTPLFLLKCMRIEQEGDIVWLLRNKRKGLKLKVTEAEDPDTCSGCYLFKIKRHCERVSEDVNLCGSENIIYKKAYED